MWPFYPNVVSPKYVNVLILYVLYLYCFMLVIFTYAALTGA